VLRRYWLNLFDTEYEGMVSFVRSLPKIWLPKQ